jgi:hypothetical protein
VTNIADDPRRDAVRIHASLLTQNARDMASTARCFWPAKAIRETGFGLIELAAPFPAEPFHDVFNSGATERNELRLARTWATVYKRDSHMTSTRPGQMDLAR